MKNLPRLISDLTIEEVHEELLIFREYGKSVIALNLLQTQVFRLCQANETFQTAVDRLGEKTTFSALAELREMALFAPSTLPRSSSLRHLTTCSVGAETLVYREADSKAVLLDPVTSEVWRLCDGVTTTEAALQHLAAHFEVSSQVAEELLWAALSHLREQHLLVLALPAPMTRRDFAKKWAVAAALFPVLTSTLVPSPSAAVSLTCASCVTSGNCASAVPGRPGPQPVCCTFNAAPPCNGRRYSGGSSDVCQRAYVITGTSCLNDGFNPSFPSAYCNTLPDGAVSNNAQVSCTAARQAAILAGFTDYDCAQCP